MAVGMTTLMMLLTPLPDVNQLAKMPEYLSAPISQLAQGNADKSSISAQEALERISESKMALAYLKENIHKGLELIDSIDNDGVESGVDIREVIERYESTAKILTGQLNLLKLTYVLAESSPTWAPHLAMLRQYSQDALRVFANNRNILLRIATVLKQHEPVNEGLYVPKASEESYRQLVNISHKKLGLKMPEWH